MQKQASSLAFGGVASGVGGADLGTTLASHPIRDGKLPTAGMLAHRLLIIDVTFA